MLPALDLQVTEVEVPSHDGVKVPMTVLHKKGLALDGSNPVLVHGYASYGHSITAYYSPDNRVWLERGGVLAFTNPRGSGVHGDDWHRAGFKSTKPNTWKDGIACVRWLIEHRYGSPSTMAIIGTSAGGIFVGRAVTEAPELFAAAIFNVGSLDTVRAEESANGATNTGEFGSVNDPDRVSRLGRDEHLPLDSRRHQIPGRDAGARRQRPACAGVGEQQDRGAPAGRQCQRHGRCCCAWTCRRGMAWAAPSRSATQPLPTSTRSCFGRWAS